MKFKFILLALFLIYVGLINAAPSARYGDYSISRRSEKTNNPIKEMDGFKPLRRQNKHDDINNNLPRQLELFADALGSLPIVNGAMEIGGMWVGTIGSVVGVVGRGSDEHNDADVGCDDGSDKLKFHKVIPSNQFQKVSKEDSGEMEKRDNPYQHIHKLRRMLDSRGYRKALNLIDNKIEDQIDIEDNDDETY